MMAQKALFFMDTMRCTQGVNVGSHTNSLATDWGGKDTGRDVIYAPFDCVVGRVRDTASHETYFHSDGLILCADGVEREVTMTLMHDDYVDVVVGQKIKQGEKIGDEGSYFGGRHGAVGNHAHVEFSAGHQSNQIYSNGTWITPYQLAIEKVCFLQSDVTILNDGGFNWVKSDETLGAKKYYGTVLVDGLRLRTLPNTDAETVQIDRLTNGNIFPITQTKDGWAFLQVTETAGGWACLEQNGTEYIAITEV